MRNLLSRCLSALSCDEHGASPAPRPYGCVQFESPVPASSRVEFPSQPDPLRPKDRGMLVVGLLIAFSLGTAALTASHFLAETRFGLFTPDFTALWTAARHPELAYHAQALTAAQAGLTQAKGLRPFPYPPTLLLLLSPFAWLPYPVAWATWAATGLAAFLWAARRDLTSTGALLAATTTSSIYAAASGQTSLLLGAGVIWSLFAAARRPGLAGAILGAVLVMKPQLALLAPLALLGSRRGLLWFATAGGGVVLASAAAFGIGAWTSWLHALPEFAQIALTNPYIPSRNLNPAGALVAAGLPAPALLHAASALAGLTLAALALARRVGPDVRAAALIVGSFLAAPYVMPYDACLLASVALGLLFRERFLPAGGALLIPAYTPWFGPGCLAVFAFGLLLKLIAGEREPGQPA